MILLFFIFIIPLVSSSVGSQFILNDFVSQDFFVVIQGSEYRINLSERFTYKLNDHNVNAKLIYALDYSHSEVNMAIGDPKDDIITPSLMEFLDMTSNNIQYFKHMQLRKIL
ncbi:MAG: hypothetical protein DRN27_09615 [Thermoplasmata archaeon]|nr:MAG: hypothetical protein DRN27_09615 [Thermoplasmata archaeon]